MHLWNSVGKALFLYAFSGIILRSISILTIPIALRYISPDEYGALSLLNSFIIIATTVIGLGLRQVFALDYFHCNRIEQLNLKNSILTIYGSIALPLVVCALFCRNQIITLLFNGAISSTSFICALSIIAATFFTELAFQLLQYQRNPKWLSFIQISAACIGALCTYLFVCILHLNYLGIIGAQCISTLYVLVVSRNIIFASYSINRTLFLQQIRQASTYIARGLPFIPGIMCSWMLSSGNRWLLARYSSLHDAGIYALADTCCQVFYFLVLNPWMSAYVPYILSAYASRKIEILSVEQENQQYMRYAVTGIAGACTIGFIALRPLVCHLLPLSYHQAISYVPLLIMGQILLLAAYFKTCILQFHKKTYILVGNLCIAALINIVIARILIPYYHIHGCAWATLIAYSIYFVLCHIHNRAIIQTYLYDNTTRVIADT